jgi:pre-mRNA-splicing factor CWC22
MSSARHVLLPDRVGLLGHWQEVSPKGLRAVFERFRGILHEGTIDKRVQYTIEGLFAVRRSNFADYPAVPETLDLVEKEDKITFEMSLEDQIDKEEMLDVFRFDPQYEENEKMWKAIKKVVQASPWLLSYC